MPAAVRWVSWGSKLVCLGLTGVTRFGGPPRSELSSRLLHSNQKLTLLSSPRPLGLAMMLNLLVAVLGILGAVDAAAVAFQTDEIGSHDQKPLAVQSTSTVYNVERFHLSSREELEEALRQAEVRSSYGVTSLFHSPPWGRSIISTFGPQPANISTFTSTHLNEHLTSSNGSTRPSRLPMYLKSRPPLPYQGSTQRSAVGTSLPSPTALSITITGPTPILSLSLNN